MRAPENAIKSQFATDDVEGYIFDGADGNQLIIWQCKVAGVSNEHVHDFDEYLFVIEGEYTTIADGKSIALKTGEEFLIPKGQAHSGTFIAGTRTVHAFGGKRAERAFL